ncbi:MAG: FkbM family methyltransferase [Chitinispirillales bacterium]|nr:FkbM family methyltransferase [Chitinispirillales bacterium]
MLGSKQKFRLERGYDLTKPILTWWGGDAATCSENDSILRDFIKNEKTGMFLPREKEEIIECLNNSLHFAFPYRFAKDLKNFEVFFDDDSKMFFVLHKNKRLYFPKNWTKDKVIKYYHSLLIEQDLRSPHCYTCDGFEVKKSDIIADVGAAEGIWALENVETAKFVYIFEPQKDYIHALYKTFDPYKEKVRIVNKYVGCGSKWWNGKVEIDDFIAKNGVEISFIKADIEGAETMMLDGMPKLLKDKQDLRMLLCAYHRQNDADNLKKTLEAYGFSIEFSQGWMLLMHDRFGLQEPYFRKGLIRARKINSVQSK